MSTPNPLRHLWMRWKAMELPWRRQYLRGYDLAGNTFWEFKDALNSNRFRRIVKYSRNTHYSDIKISPQWHQWLRHTRQEIPTVQEQEQDLVRQVQIKELARRADERWAALPSARDPIEKQQPTPALGIRDPGGHQEQTETEDKQGVRNAVGSHEQVQGTVQGKDVDEGRFKGETRERQGKQLPWMEGPWNAPSQEEPQGWTPKPERRG